MPYPNIGLPPRQGVKGVGVQPGRPGGYAPGPLEQAGGPWTAAHDSEAKARLDHHEIYGPVFADQQRSISPDNQLAKSLGIQPTYGPSQQGPTELKVGGPPIGGFSLMTEPQAFRQRAIWAAQGNSPGDGAGVQTMLPDPSKQAPAIGVAPRGQRLTPAVSGGSFQSVPPAAPAPNFTSHADMRGVALATLSKQMQEAHASGNNAALVNLFAQRGALDNGGFEGQARFLRDQSLHDAQVDQLGYKVGKLPTTQDGSYDAEGDRQRALLKTGDAGQADSYVQGNRIAHMAETERLGKPFTIDPSDAPAIISSRAPHVAQFLQGAAGGGSSTGDLPTVLASIRSADPKIFDKPDGVVAQAIGQRLRQIYGTELQGEIHLPDMNPNVTRAAIDTFSRHPEMSPIPGLAPLLNNQLGRWYANNIVGVFVNHDRPRLNPETDYNDRQAAAEMYRRLTTPRTR